MKRMRLVIKASGKWLPQAPRWIALLLLALIAVDAAHFCFQLRAHAHTVADPRALATRAASSPLVLLDPQRIAGAHLFGVDPAATRAGAARPATQPHLALSGVIATSDPNEGYAILGEQGQSTHLYRTGAELGSVSAGTLYQVFADHVLLDFDGRRETLPLPRQLLVTHAPVRVARLDVPAADAAAIPMLYSQREDAPSAAEGWFSNLNGRAYAEDGRKGLELHPLRLFQRRYGLHDGDLLTAVNGVPVADEDALGTMLRAGPKTVALTLTRNGVEETLRFPVDE